MEEYLGDKGKTIPGRLATRTLELYRKGRAKLVSVRYGNPASTVRVIAVTGHYGKTTTGLLLLAILKEAGRTAIKYEHVASDDAVSELQRELKEAKGKGAEFFVVEVTPELMASGALTGVSVDTVIAMSPSVEADELLKQNVSYVVIPDDYQAGKLAIADHQIITFGEQETAEARINKVALYRKGTEVEMTIDHHTSLTVATHLVGSANAYNLAAAIASAYVLGIPFNTVEEGAASVEKVEGNYEYLKGERPYVVVTDSAEANRSIELVVDSTKELSKRRLLVALIAGTASDSSIQHVKKMANRLVLVSPEEMALPGIEVVGSAEEAWRIVSRAAKLDDTVLLMGKEFVSQKELFSISSTSEEKESK